MCGAHATVRGFLGELVAKSPDAFDVIVDMEAGLEHLSRGTGKHVSRFLAVVEPYYRSMETARRVADLAAELGAQFGWDGLLHARGRLVNAAKAAGLQAWDVPHIDLKRPDDLGDETRKILALGFGCKTAIHPQQISIIHAAFAPSPAEREALRRGLGSGSGNASLEMLPTLSEVEAIGGGRRSLPPSPSNVPALPNAPTLSKMPTSVNVGVVGAIGEGSMRNGGVGGSIKQHQQQASSGLGWLASFPRMRKEKLSPWEDEVVRTSSSGKAVDRGQVGLNGIIGMPVNIRESWDKKRSDGNEGEGDRRMMG